MYELYLLLCMFLLHHHFIEPLQSSEKVAENPKEPEVVGSVSVTAYGPGAIETLTPDSDLGKSEGEELLPFTCIVKSVN